MPTPYRQPDNNSSTLSFIYQKNKRRVLGKTKSQFVNGVQLKTKSNIEKKKKMNPNIISHLIVVLFTQYRFGIPIIFQTSKRTNQFRIKSNTSQKYCVCSQFPRAWILVSAYRNGCECVFDFWLERLSSAMCFSNPQEMNSWKVITGCSGGNEKK